MFDIKGKITYMDNNKNLVETAVEKTDYDFSLKEVPVNETPKNRNTFMYIALILIILIFGICGLIYAFNNGNVINFRNMDYDYYSKDITIKLPDHHYMDYEGYVYYEEDSLLYSRFMVYADEFSEIEFAEYISDIVSSYNVEPSTLNNGALYSIRNMTIDGSDELFDYFFYYKDGVILEVNSFSEDYDMVMNVIKSLKVGK